MAESGRIKKHNSTILKEEDEFGEWLIILYVQEDI